MPIGALWCRRAGSGALLPSPPPPHASSRAAAPSNVATVKGVCDPVRAGVGRSPGVVDRSRSATPSSEGVGAGEAFTTNSSKAVFSLPMWWSDATPSIAAHTKPTRCADCFCVLPKPITLGGDARTLPMRAVSRSPERASNAAGSPARLPVRAGLRVEGLELDLEGIQRNAQAIGHVLRAAVG